MRVRLHDQIVSLNLLLVLVLGVALGFAIIMTMNLRGLVIPRLLLTWAVLLALLPILCIAVPRLSAHFLCAQRVTASRGREDPASLIMLPVIIAAVVPAVLGAQTGRWFLAASSLLVGSGVAVALSRILRSYFPEEEMHDSVCLNCGYDIRATLTRPCPECGYTTWTFARWEGAWVVACLQPPAFGCPAILLGPRLSETLSEAIAAARAKRGSTDMDVALPTLAGLEPYEVLDQDKQPTCIWLNQHESWPAARFCFVRNELFDVPATDADVFDPETVAKRACPEILEQNRRINAKHEVRTFRLSL